MTISGMSDTELVRAIAEEVMGWSLVNHAGCDWWDTGVDDNERYWPTLHFVPLLDYNHTFVVVERMRKLGWRFEMTECDEGIDAGFWKEIGGGAAREVSAINPDTKRAILEAALSAKRGMK